MRLLQVLPFLFIVPNPTIAEKPFAHHLLDQVLKAHVSADGQVRYAALATNRGPLDAYIDRLGDHSPENNPELFPTPLFELAYWINAYNAFVLRGVIDAYPISSVKDAFFLNGFFNRQKFVAGGRSMTLNDIENGIIRARYGEPRIHFVLNCGARSCPQLENRAFNGTTLNTQLDQALKRFANDPKHVRFEGKRLYLSKILDWYREDFSEEFIPDHPNAEGQVGIVRYLFPYWESSIADQLIGIDILEVEFFDYDWALNDANTTESIKEVPHRALNAPKTKTELP